MAEKPKKVDPFKQAKYEVEDALNMKRNDRLISRKLRKTLKDRKWKLRKVLKGINLVPKKDRKKKPAK